MPLASSPTLEPAPAPNTPIPQRAPRLKGWPVVGVAWHMRQAPLAFLLKAFQDHPGDAVFMKLGHYRATLVRHPDQVKRVFVDNIDNYSKQTRGYQKARIALGDGLVTSEGELWQRQRRIATPAFHRQRVAGFVSVFTESADALLADWRTQSAGGAPIDLFGQMMRVTLRIALQTLLGTTAESEMDLLSPAVTEILERTNDIITNPLSLPEWVPTPKHRRFRRAIDTVDQFVYATISLRRRQQESGEPAHDLLSMLLGARDEITGQGMSDQLLRDEAVTILIAGHETTANVLTWALYLLSTHPEQREALEAELATTLNGRTPTAADLPNLKYTKACVEEAMRLYPPAWMIGRAARDADTLGGAAIGAGEFVLVSPFVSHRNPNFWDNPAGFDPTRFLDGRSEALPKFTYIPFGGGQRFCIGANFALIEATLLLAMIAGAVRLQVLDDPPVEPWAMITLRPRYGMRAKLNWRT